MTFGVLVYHYLNLKSKKGLSSTSHLTVSACLISRALRKVVSRKEEQP